MPSIDKAITNSDYEYLKSIIEIHRCLLEIFEDEFFEEVTENSDFHIFLEVITKICSFNDFRLLYETFHLWIDISDSLNERPGRSLIYPIVEKYGNIFLKQLYENMPVDEDLLHETLYVMDDEEVASFRKHSIDVLVSLFSVIESKNYYNNIIGCLKANPTSFNVIEGSLYFLISVIPTSKIIDHNELVLFILSFPAESPLLLLETSCKVLSELAPILLQYDSPQVENIFSFLLRCLSHSWLQMAASDSLLLYCCKGSKYLISKIENIINIISNSISKAKDTQIVDTLSKCCVTLISKGDINSIPLQLSQLCSLQLAHVTQLLKNKNDSKHVDLYSPLETVSSIFKFLKIPRDMNLTPFVPLINQIIHFALNLLEATAYSENICEKSCRLLRYIIRFIGPLHSLGSDLSQKVNIFS
uniref:Transportin-3 (Trinotate prediction) n=1 Tax=Henneguya salminicola TaxID=69463 RepID=A0A6G3ME21_HENSL